MLNPDLGDSWVYYYAFERDVADNGKSEEILKRCVKAEPHHGRLWISISKKPGNWRLKTEEILRIGIKGIKEDIDKIEWL